jgi:hypothetical protein
MSDSESVFLKVLAGEVEGREPIFEKIAEERLVKEKAHRRRVAAIARRGERVVPFFGRVVAATDE